MKTKEYITHDCPAGCKNGIIQSVKGDRQCNTCKGMTKILTHQMRKYKNI